ncbi:MAG: alcohol dehydrogenase catalytic domain-containing protein, partial [Planctomycetota bacterium]
MKSVVLSGIGRMELVDLPEPSIKRDSDVLLKVEMVGVCGSDVHYYETGRIGSQIVKYPFMVGHECTATVKAVGATVKRVRAGDRVAVDPAITCGSCDQCRQGRRNTCRNLKFLGCPGQVEG